MSHSLPSNTLLSSPTCMHPPRSRKPIKRKKQQLLISQPIHHQQNIHTQRQSLNYNNGPKRKRARYTAPSSLRSSSLSMQQQQKQNEYRPKHIYSQILPLQSSKQMLTEYDGTKLINFSCIGYESLVKYCQMFKLHDFEYNYHYDLAKQQQQQTAELTKKNEAQKEDEKDTNRESARIGKLKYSKKENVDGTKNKKNNKKKSKKNKNDNKNNNKESKHIYLNCDALDAHYEEKSNGDIPKSFAESSRLTKSELVEIVSQHFLSQPLLAELNEIDVIRQFLLFIQNRRKRLKREFCLD